MKYLIVNGDDFGASRGINRAIIELHDLGVLTSASLMVTMPAAAEAARLTRNACALGVGLHVALTDEGAAELVDFDDNAACARAIEAQVDGFSQLMGRLPTHIDAHQNVHRDARLRPLFQEIAARHALPLREHSPVRYFSSFYGQWEGEPHPEQIGIENLLAMLESELDGGITELSCHPGYRGSDFTSPYDSERELEVRTLSDPRLREFFRTQDVRLINFVEARPLCGGASSA